MFSFRASRTRSSTLSTPRPRLFPRHAGDELPAAELGQPEARYIHAHIGERDPHAELSSAEILRTFAECLGDGRVDGLWRTAGGHEAALERLEHRIVTGLRGARCACVGTDAAG